MTESGLISQAESSYVWLPITIAAAGAVPLFGYLFDHVQSKAKLLATVPALAALSMFLCFRMDSIGQLLLFGIVFGTLDAATSIGTPIVLAHTFGRAHLATLTSFKVGVDVFALGLGPLLFGLDKDITGHYYHALGGISAVSLVVCLFLLVVRPPQFPAGRSQATLTD